jgi:hypothetical protein
MAGHGSRFRTQIMMYEPKIVFQFIAFGEAHLVNGEIRVVSMTRFQIGSDVDQVDEKLECFAF